MKTCITSWQIWKSMIQYEQMFVIAKTSIVCDHWKLHIPSTSTLPSLPVRTGKQQPEAVSKRRYCSPGNHGVLFVRAMTDDGHNDTSAAKARSAEYPAMVKFQWNRLAADRLLNAAVQGIRSNRTKYSKKTKGILHIKDQRKHVGRQIRAEDRRKTRSACGLRSQRGRMWGKAERNDSWNECGKGVQNMIRRTKKKSVCGQTCGQNKNQANDRVRVNEDGASAWWRRANALMKTAALPPNEAKSPPRSLISERSERLHFFISEASSLAPPAHSPKLDKLVSGSPRAGRLHWKILAEARIFLVGVRRFELPASWSRTKRSTKLSHTPIFSCVLNYITQSGICQELFCKKSVILHIKFYIEKSKPAVL